jgi:undecaprenyl-diphosphatase
MSFWEIHTQWFMMFFSLAHRWGAVDVAIVFIAEILPLLLGGILLLHLLSLRKSERLAREFVFIFGPAVAAWFFAVLIKQVFPFPRPFAYFFDLAPLVSMSDAFGAFPSEHAVFFSALGYALFLHERHWGELYLVAAFAIGVARITAGIHWPMDIIVGFTFGLLFAQSAHVLERRLFDERSHTAIQTRGER